MQLPNIYISFSIVVPPKSLYFPCHSGRDQACPVPDTGESSVFELDSRFRGNDRLRRNANSYLIYYNLEFTMACFYSKLACNF